MKIGKIPNDILEKLILNKISANRKEILLRPKIGEDCCAVDFDKYACVLSTDPITGTANEIGRLAVHISCNDIASCGVEPLGLLVTILAPPGTSEAELEKVMSQLCETAASINVDIIGGHTEITAAVNRFVVTSTALGRVLKDRLVSTSGAKPGNDIVLTKSAGLEGTAILAYDREKALTGALGLETVERAKNLMEKISVVKEGIIAGEYGATSMHDVTEGGVLGAVWEVAEASGVGVIIEKVKIPVGYETVKICSFYGIDPLKLISSGCMLITCPDGEGLTARLSASGISSSIIGRITSENKKILMDGGVEKPILQPESDELYKVLD